MLFKDLYRKYKAEEARKKKALGNEVSQKTQHYLSDEASSGDRDSRYFELKELSSIYQELDQLNTQINQLKESIKILQRSHGDKGQMHFQTSLVRAFEQERHDLSMRELNEPFKAI